MTACWPTAPLGALVACLDARRVPLNRARRARRPGPVPYYGASGIIGHVDEALFDGPLVLLGEDSAPFLDPMRDVAFFHDGPLWAGNHVHVLRPRPHMDGRFLAHALNTLDYAPYVEGTTRPKLVRARMNDLPVPCPPLDQQRKIGDALDQALRRIDRQLGELAHQSGLAQEREEAEILHALSAARTDGGIRPLGATFSITGGGTPSTSRPEYWGRDVAWITPADLPAGPPAWVSHGARGLSFTGLAACRATLVAAGALVISTRAPVGRVGMGAGPLAVSQGCKALVPRGRDVDLCYAALALHAAGPELRRRAGGSVFPEVDTATLASLEICLPPLHTQRAVAQGITELLAGLREQDRARDRLASTLREYRVAIRRAAMGGHLPA